MTRFALALALCATSAAADVTDGRAVVECMTSAQVAALALIPGTPGMFAPGRYGPLSPTWALPPSQRVRLDNPPLRGPTPIPPPVPLPASWWLLGGALAGLMLWRRFA